MAKVNKSEKVNKKRTVDGIVVSNSMDKTIKVQVNYQEVHPVYMKRLQRRKVYFAHAAEKPEIGAKVTIMECKPYSKNVKWKIVNV